MPANPQGLFDVLKAPIKGFSNTAEVIVFLLVSLLMYSIYNLIPTDPARAQLEPMRTTLKPEEYEQRYQMLRQQMGS